MSSTVRLARGSAASPAGTASLLALFLALGVGAVELSGCPNSCKPPGFSEGERFQITVESRATKACTIAPLAPGDSFILTAAAARQDAESCTVLGASPEVPSFATSVLTSCQQALSQLGLACAGMIGAACHTRADLSIGPYISPSDATIDDGVLGIVWTASACNPGGCVERYNVRIDRLP